MFLTVGVLGTMFLTDCKGTMFLTVGNYVSDCRLTMFLSVE